jgi:hypothetical protein
MSITNSPHRWKVLATVGATVVVFGAGLGIASAADDEAVGTISCPSVDIASLGAVPASANAEVERNLAQLNTQIAEANNRLRTSVGQGGPNFVQNAILGPLADKRAAAIDRIAIAIGRQGVRPNLNIAALSQCSVGGAAAEQPVEVPPAGAGAGNGAGNGEGADNGDGGDAVEVGVIRCPDLDVASLGAIPASAADEVRRNIALLATQLTEANNRLRSTVGQGGPNFVRNAILGPLASKRTATINRIATAIGRQGVRPNLNVAALSTCAVAAE